MNPPPFELLCSHDVLEVGVCSQEPLRCFLFIGSDGPMAAPLFIHLPLMQHSGCLSSYKKLLLTFVYKLLCGHMFPLLVCVFSYK